MSKERTAAASCRVAAALAAAFVLSCSAACSLSRTDVQLAAGDLRSFAASAQMLAQQCSQGRATQTFCQQQAELLSYKVEDALRELNGHAVDAEAERAHLQEIAVRLREIVRQPVITWDDAAEAGRLASASRTLEDSLKK